MENSDSLREHIVNLLTKAEAHVDVRSELESFPTKLRGRKPPGAPHTPWQLLEHIRIAQWDILRFSVDANHASPKWPEGYWPENDTPPSDKAWEKSVRQFLADLNAMCELVRDPARDLLARIPHGTGQTLLREALLLADHNAYHLGQLVMVRKTLESEKEHGSRSRVKPPHSPKAKARKNRSARKPRKTTDKYAEWLLSRQGTIDKDIDLEF